MADSPQAPDPARPAQPAPSPKAPRKLGDRNASRVSVLVHTALALALGWYANSLGNLALGAALGIGALIVVGYGLAFLLGHRGIPGLKWWMGNGGLMYLFFFLVSWAWFLNA